MKTITRYSIPFLLVSRLAGCSANSPGIDAGANAETPDVPASALDLGALRTAAAPGPPVSGGTLAVGAWGGVQIAVLADPDGDRIWTVNLQTHELHATSLEPGAEPGRVVVDSDGGRAYVVLRRAGQVAILDSTGEVVSRAAACPAPRGLAHDPVAHTLTVACLGGELVTMPDEGGAPTRVLTLDDDLRDVVLDAASGATLVSRFRSAEVLIVNPGGTVEERVRLPAFRNGFVPEVAWRMVATPGGALVVHQRASGGPVDLASPDGYGGRGPVCNGIVHTAYSMIGEGRVRSSVAVPGTLPVDIAYDPSSARIAFAFASKKAVPIPGAGKPPPGGAPIDPCTAGPEPQDRPIHLGAAPGPTPSPTFPTIVDDVAPRGQPVAAAFTASGTLVRQTRLPLALVWGGHELLIDPQTEKLDTGDALFHLDSGGGIACASCHAEGGDDGRVWHFDHLGSRRTISLRGGALGKGPFHWDGSLPDFPALVTEVFVRRMGGPQPGGRQMAALERYVGTMPSPARPAPTDVAAAQRGEALLLSADTGCASCHAQASVVDVGTGDGPMKAPLLHELAYHAPYLHNGCAATLMDRFGPCGGDRHGSGAPLTPDQIVDLAAYLSTL